MNFWNFLVSRLRLSVSLFSFELSSLVSTSAAFDFSARLLIFFSRVSISFNLIISSSCSLNFPKSVVVVRVVKSLFRRLLSLWAANFCPNISESLYSASTCQIVFQARSSDFVTDFVIEFMTDFKNIIIIFLL